MNNNIFNLKSDYITILNAIEEADGEIDENLGELLKATEETATEKAEEFVKMKHSLDSDVSIIDDEISRLKLLKESKLKALDTIKASLLWIVNNFGDTGKTGNKTIKLAIATLFTRTYESCDIISSVNINNKEYVRHTINSKFTDEQLAKIENVIPGQFSSEKVILKDILKDDLKKAETGAYIIDADGTIDISKNSLVLNCDDEDNYPETLLTEHTLFNYNFKLNRYLPVASIVKTQSVTVK